MVRISGALKKKGLYSMNANNARICENIIKALLGKYREKKNEKIDFYFVMFINISMISYEELIQQIDKEIPTNLIKDTYTSYDLLGLAVKFLGKLHFGTSSKLINLADKISNIDDYDFYYLYRHSVMMNLAMFKNKYEEEYQLYEPIKHFICDLIENSEIVEHEIINKKVPDIFLSVNNELCVGEVKPRYFTNTHVKQLRMYMETYKTKIGYAFGLKLTEKLDDNMIFINIDGIKDRFYIN